MINMLFVCDSGISQILLFVKNTLNMIMIVAPILAIIYISIGIAKLVRNPDEKNGLGKLKNILIALTVIFFIPLFINVLFYMIGENSAVSDCWNKVGNVNYSTTYMPIGENKNHSIYTDPSEYEKGEKKPEQTETTETSDTSNASINSCGSLEYCNKFLTSLYNNSKKLNDAILKNNAPVEYNYKKSKKTWAEAIALAEQGKLVATTCVVPANWGIRDTIGNQRVVYSEGKGGFHNYSGNITKYTKQIKYNGSISVKEGIQKGLITPGDIVGVSNHTFAIYSVNKDGSAVVADGGHQFTNKCQKSKKCSTLFTYSSKQNANYKVYQLIKWVK